MLNKAKQPQKCKDHAMWQKQLLIAQWVFIVLGLGFLFFADNLALGLAFSGMSFLIFSIGFLLDILHMKWHIRQDGDINKK